MEKLGYMLEQLENPTVLTSVSENPFGGANQQATKAAQPQVGASEATRQAPRSSRVMIWSALRSDTESQTEQETIWPRHGECRSNNLDLRPSSVHHVADSEYDCVDVDVVGFDRRSIDRHLDGQGCTEEQSSDENIVNCWNTLRAMRATAQSERTNAKAEKAHGLGNQQPSTLTGEGSTTRARARSGQAAAKCDDTLLGGRYSLSCSETSRAVAGAATAQLSAHGSVVVVGLEKLNKPRFTSCDTWA